MYVLKFAQETLQLGLSEEDLVNIYQDLLALPTPSGTQESLQQRQQSQAETDQTMMLAIEQRLFENLPDADTSTMSPLTSTLRNLRAQTSTAQSLESSEQIEEGGYEVEHAKPYQRTAVRLKSIIEKLDAVRATVELSGMQESLPISILSLQEWQALIRTCVCLKSFR